MNYLIDTNVLSELRKRERAHPLVVDWFQKRKPQEVFLSVLTLGELRRGVERLYRRDPKTAHIIGTWLEQIPDRFQDRILHVDQAVAEQWGRLGVLASLPDVDGLIAATALVYDMVVVTRNVKHIAPTGVRHVNPFTPATPLP